MKMSQNDMSYLGDVHKYKKNKTSFTSYFLFEYFA